MTDRINGVWVTFENPMREDDAQPLMAAIMRLKGVIGVTPVVQNHEAFMVEMQVANRFKEKLWQALEVNK